MLAAVGRGGGGGELSALKRGKGEVNTSFHEGYARTRIGSSQWWRCARGNSSAAEERR